jgi:hypothetical protein
MSKQSETTREVSREEFEQERGRLLEMASTGVVVVVTDDRHQPRTIYTTPRDKQPMRFE